MSRPKNKRAFNRKPIMTSNSNKLKQLVSKTVKEVFLEVAENDSQEAFNRLQELKKYESLFYYMDKVGVGPISEVLSVRENSADYSEFYNQVGPGKYDRSTGRYNRNNKFGMRADTVKMFWDLDIGLNEVKTLFEEYQELKDRFEYKTATSTADAMYGRKRTVVIDKLTGEKVSSTTDRQGSLGT